MAKMRIISGIYKNKEILTPGTDKTHPMGSREKLALFNMILPYLPEKRVLDAFAGSGALGLEALSRGASEAVFVEKDEKAVKIIKENLKSLGVTNATVVKSTVDAFEPEEKFDLIFADPPYNKFEKSQIEHLARFLSSDGTLVLSSPEPVDLPGLKLLKSRKYAGCIISIFVV